MVGTELKPRSLVAEFMDLTITLSDSHSFHILQVLRCLGGTMLGMEVIQGMLVIPGQIILFL